MKKQKSSPRRSTLRESVREARRDFRARMVVNPMRAHIALARDYYHLSGEYQSRSGYLIKLWLLWRAALNLEQAWTKPQSLLTLDEVTTAATVLIETPDWLGGNVGHADALVAFAFDGHPESAQMPDDVKAVLLTVLNAIHVQQGEVEAARQNYETVRDLLDKIKGEFRGSEFKAELLRKYAWVACFVHDHYKWCSERRKGESALKRAYEEAKASGLEHLASLIHLWSLRRGLDFESEADF